MSKTVNILSYLFVVTLGTFRKNMTQSQICKFYDGQHVFITGGNGFIGKILVEKLLRSTNVAIIYLLMRTKKGKDVYTRLEELLKNEVSIAQPSFDILI